MHIWPLDEKPDTYPRPRPCLEDYQAAAESIGAELLMRPPIVGELYIAGRNTGLKLFTAREISDKGWIVADEVPVAYPYDTHECIAVKSISILH